MLLCKSYVKRKIFLKHYIAVNGDHEHTVSVAKMVPVREPWLERAPKAVVVSLAPRSAQPAPRRRQHARKRGLALAASLANPPWAPTGQLGWFHLLLYHL